MNLENHRLRELVLEFRAAKTMEEVVSGVGHYSPRLERHGSRWALRNFTNTADLVSFLNEPDAKEFCMLLWPQRLVYGPAVTASPPIR